MNKDYLIPIAIIIAGALVGGILLFSGNPQESSSAQNLRQLNLSIKGMFCIGCEAGIESSLSQLSGVIKVEADAKNDSGLVVYNPNKISKEEILAAPIFKTYSAKVTSDKPYTGSTQFEKKELPPEIKNKLNLLAKKLNQENTSLSTSEIQKINSALESKDWSKAEEILKKLLEE